MAHSDGVATMVPLQLAGEDHRADRPGVEAEETGRLADGQRDGGLVPGLPDRRTRFGRMLASGSG